MFIGQHKSYKILNFEWEDLKKMELSRIFNNVETSLFFSILFHYKMYKLRLVIKLYLQFSKNLIVNFLSISHNFFGNFSKV